MRSGELFAGVGGLGMAVDEVFGSRPAWFAEFDEAPSKVLAHHYPDVPNFGDVTKIIDPPKVEILAGGFPCQDVSLAGRRRGLKDGTRSGLWSEFARLIDTIRPDWVVVENVRGLLSADAAGDVEPCPWCLGNDGEQHALRALGAVLGYLADLGFDAEWAGLRASDVGAPHGRFRVFILAWPRDRVSPDASSFGRGEGRAESARVVGRSHDVVGGSSADLTLLPTPVVTDSKGARNATSGRKKDSQHHSGTTLTDAVTLLPTPGAYDGERGGSQNPDKRRAGGHSVTLQDVAEHALLPTPTVGNATGGNAQRGGNRADEKLLPGLAREHATDWGPYTAAIRRWEAVTGRPAPAPVRYDGKGGKPRLNPELPEWMMGWESGWVTDPAIGLSRAEQLKACGNGVVARQAATALRELLARPGVPSLLGVAA